MTLEALEGALKTRTLKARDDVLALPVEEQLISLGYDLADVFGEGPDAPVQEIESFYDLTTWEGYGKFISSELCKRTKRPNTNTMYRGRTK